MQIEALFNSRLEDHYGDLANHYSRSGNRLKALEYLQLAAQQAIERSANTEAINHLTAAGAFVEYFARDSAAESAGIGLTDDAWSGSDSDEGQRSRRKSEPSTSGRWSWADRSGEEARLFPVLFGLRSFHLIRAELPAALDLGTATRELAGEYARLPVSGPGSTPRTGNSLVPLGRSDFRFGHF